MPLYQQHYLTCPSYEPQLVLVVAPTAVRGRQQKQIWRPHVPADAGYQLDRWKKIRNVLFINTILLFLDRRDLNLTKITQNVLDSSQETNNVAFEAK